MNSQCEASVTPREQTRVARDGRQTPARSPRRPLSGVRMVAPWTDAQIGTERYPVWFIEEFRRSAEARRVDRDDDECWPWSETVAQSGIYGVFSRRRDGIIYSDRVHRLSVIAYKAGVPAGMHATHSCDWRPCYNPGHLDARTPEENTHDTFQRNVHIRQSMRESQLRRWREARA